MFELSTITTGLLVILTLVFVYLSIRNADKKFSNLNYLAYALIVLTISLVAFPITITADYENICESVGEKFNFLNSNRVVCEATVNGATFDKTYEIINQELVLLIQKERIV